VADRVVVMNQGRIEQIGRVTLKVEGQSELIEPKW
jgi:ABC-type sulfate/molybdate transport systems ATPase subunit